MGSPPPKQSALAPPGSLRVAAALAWLTLAGVAAAMLVAGRSPAWLLAAGALVAFALRERDAGGWTGFLASSLLRAGDAALLAGLAWHLAEHRGSGPGAAAAVTALALGLLAAYVRVRALSLGVESGTPTGTSAERGIRLALLAGALFWGGVDSTRPIVAGLTGAAAVSAWLAATRARRIWRSAPHA